MDETDEQIRERFREQARSRSVIDGWKAASRVELDLPSGLRLRGVYPSIDSLLWKGRLPDELRPMARNLALPDGLRKVLAKKEDEDAFRELLGHLIAAFRERRASR